MLRVKWLLYTVLVGLIPVLARLIVYAISPKATQAFMWGEADLASFALALNIANISVIEHESTAPGWKTIVNGMSLLHVVFLGVVFTLSFLKDIDPSIVAAVRLRQAAGVLSVTSLILSFTVYDRLARAQHGAREVST
jgi:hypothetical protein